MIYLQGKPSLRTAFVLQSLANTPFAIPLILLSSLLLAPSSPLNLPSFRYPLPPYVYRGSILDETEAEVLATHRMTFLSAFSLLQAVARHLLQPPGGGPATTTTPPSSSSSLSASATSPSGSTIVATRSPPPSCDRCIILIGSVMAGFSPSGAAAYTTAKVAVRQLGQTAANELGPLGIRVNVVQPG